MPRCRIRALGTHFGTRTPIFPLPKVPSRNSPFSRLGFIQTRIFGSEHSPTLPIPFQR